MSCWPSIYSKSPKLGTSSSPPTSGPKNPDVGRVGWSDDTVWLNAGKTNAHEGHRAMKPGTDRITVRARGGLGLPHRGVPGLPQVAQGSEGPHAIGRGNRPLPKDCRRPERNHPHHGRDRRCHRRLTAAGPTRSRLGRRRMGYIGVPVDATAASGSGRPTGASAASARSIRTGPTASRFRRSLAR